MPLSRSMLLGLLTWAFLIAAAPAHAQPSSRVSAGLVSRVAQEGSVRVLVRLAADVVPEGDLASAGALSAQRRRIAGAQARLATDLLASPPHRRRDFQSIPVSAMEVDAEGLAALARSPWVDWVEEDRLNVPQLDGTVIIVEADQAIASGFDGTGQAVVVLDTGVDRAHPNLAAEVVHEACFASGSNGPSGSCPNGQETQYGDGAAIYCDYSDLCFHGTHVTNIAGGYGATYSGVAPGADLISIQVASKVTQSLQCSPDPAPCPRFYDSDLIDALEYVLDPLHGIYTIAAVNMSLGQGSWTSEAGCDADNTSMKLAIDNLRSVGIASVVSAGNDSTRNALSAPACISSAISVSAPRPDETGPAWFANRASFLDLWAPGELVKSARYKTSGFFAKSGTSMAAPHVAGAFAILRQAFPLASVDEILWELQATGKPISAPQSDTTRIRIQAALDGLGPDCNDGIDNDGDSLLDLDDPGCIDAADESEKGDGACDDDADNDGDGLVDLDDPGCMSAFSPVEDPQCNDGIDNDNDLAIDTDDPQCSEAWYDREAPAGSSCGLGVELALLLAPLMWLRGRRGRVRG